LREENGTLKKSMDAKESGGHASRDEAPEALSTSSKVIVVNFITP